MKESDRERERERESSRRQSNQCPEYPVYCRKIKCQGNAVALPFRSVAEQREDMKNKKIKNVANLPHI